MQYTRNDLAFTRGTFRVRGDTVEIIPVYEELAIRIEFFGDEIERIYTLHPLTGEVVREETGDVRLPGDALRRRSRADGAGDPRHRARARGPARRVREAGQAARGPAAADAHHLRRRDDAPGRVLLRHRELQPAHRRPRPGARRRTACSTTSPRTSSSSSTSRTSPCRRSARCTRATCRASATSSTTASGCPSAMDNRPLRWEEFLERIGQTVYLSATPGQYELAKRDGVVEQIIRPTGLVDPEVVLKPTKGQIDDLLHEIRERAPRNERVLVTTLTKKMAEDLTDYLLEQGRPGPLPAQRGRHPAAGRAAARAADGRVRRARRHQPAARGSRPARGVAGQHPRRRQGGLPAVGPSA